MRHLLRITIKHLGIDFGFPEIATNPTLRTLTPTWVIHIGIHIGIKPVLMGGGFVPGAQRLLFGKPNFDNGLNAFKAVFPGHHQA